MDAKVYVFLFVSLQLVCRSAGLVDEGMYQALVMQNYRRGSLAKAMNQLWFSDMRQNQRLKLAVQVCGSSQS
jgi:hypothetical protein